MRTLRIVTTRLISFLVFVRTFIPGWWDGWIWLTLVHAICVSIATQAHSSTSFAASRFGQFVMLPGVVGVLLASAIVPLSLVILGTNSLFRRWLFGTVWILPSAIGAAYVRSRSLIGRYELVDPWHLPEFIPFVGIEISASLTAMTFLVALSLLVQVCVDIRLWDLSKDTTLAAPNKPKQWHIGVVLILLMVAISQYAATVSHSSGMPTIFRSSTVTHLTGECFAMLVLFCPWWLIRRLFCGRIRFYAPFLVIGLLPPVAYSAVILIQGLSGRAVSRSVLDVNTAIWALMIGFFVPYAIVKVWLGRQGVIFADRRKWELARQQTSLVSVVRRNWGTRHLMAIATSTVTIAAVALGCHLSERFISLHGLRTGPWGKKLSYARREAKISSLLGIKPSTVSSSSATWRYRGKAPKVYIDYETAEEMITAESVNRIDNGLLETILAIGDNFDTLQIQPFCHENVVVLNRDLRVGWLLLDCRDITTGDLNLLARRVQADRVVLTFEEFSRDHARLLSRFRDRSHDIPDILLTLAGRVPTDVYWGLDEVHLNCLTLTPNEHGSPEIPEELSSDRLVLQGYEITDDVVEKLGRLKHVGDIQLNECILGQEAIESLKMVRLPRLFLSNIQNESQIQRTDLRQIVANDGIQDLRVVGDDEVVNELVRLWGCVRRGADLMPQDREFGDILEKFKESADLDTLLAELAHEISRDEQGNITALNLEQFYLKPATLRRLSNLGELRHLRVAHPEYHNDTWMVFEELKQLTSLEVPAYFISDGGLQSISRLNRLQRLQLPCPCYSNFITPFKPELLLLARKYARRTDNFILANRAAQRAGVVDIRDVLWKTENRGPMPKWFSSTDVIVDSNEQEISERSDVDEIDVERLTMRMTGTGLASLVKLRDLEYLFLPGWLVNDQSINTIVGFAKLTELHAPFSEMNTLQLERLSELPVLRRLTLGLDLADDEAIDALCTFKDIEYLRLTAVDDQNPQLQEYVTRLRATLPTARIEMVGLSDRSPDTVTEP